MVLIREINSVPCLSGSMEWGMDVLLTAVYPSYCDHVQASLILTYSKKIWYHLHHRLSFDHNNFGVCRCCRKNWLWYSQTWLVYTHVIYRVILCHLNGNVANTIFFIVIIIFLFFFFLQNVLSDYIFSWNGRFHVWHLYQMLGSVVMCYICLTLWNHCPL